MVVVVDTCSLHRLVEYYLPLDKSGKIVPLLEGLFMSNDILMTEAVHLECSRVSKGIILDKLPFLKSKEFKSHIIAAGTFLPDRTLMNIVNESFTIKVRFNSLVPEQQEAQKNAYLQSADFSLIICAYMQKKRMANDLFGDDLRILTDESAAENDNKCFKKIPSSCKAFDTKTINIREYLEFITDGKIELIING